MEAASTEPERRRRRPAVSCILCRRRKIRCNRESPCSNCLKSKNATCAYRDAPRPSSHPRPTRPSPLHGSVGDPDHLGQPVGAPPPPPLSPSSAPSSYAPSHRGSTESTTAIIAPSRSAAEPAIRSQQEPRSGAGPERDREAPEKEPSLCPDSTRSSVSTFTRDSRVETRELAFSGNFYFHCEHRPAGQGVTRSVTHKRRLFGPSHWINAVALLHDMFRVLESQARSDVSKVVQFERRCKSLARVIKARRSPPWPCPPTPDLPARVVADALLDCYLRTSESTLRILHIPSLRRDYEAIWDSGSTPDPAFIVQLKLAMAIGAAVYDSTFSLRPSAMRWIYEAQTWTSAPEFKSRLGIPALQASLLLLLAREIVGVGEDMVWVSAGSTLRMAIYMGLHRDPAGLGPRSTTSRVVETRRRLWNTVLELSLQLSLSQGGPPLIRLDDFDTEPPRNFDDEQLHGDPGDDPIPKPDSQFTQTSVAVALRRTFPQRLAIVHYLNDLSSRATYSETLRLDAELRDAYKAVTQTLQSCKSPTGGPSSFELRTVDLLMRRYFLALHYPFFAPALRDAAFAFSRRVVVDSSLRLWRCAFPSPLSIPLPEDTASSSSDELLSRLAICGWSFFRTVAMQGFVAIAVELRTLIAEEAGLGVGPFELRPELFLALEDYKVWSWRGLESGETNTKGYMVSCIVLAQVDGLRKGLRGEEMEAYVVKAAEDAEERALALLQEIEARDQTPGDAGLGIGADALSGGLSTPGELGVGDWDYMMTDSVFDSVGVGMDWVFQFGLQ